jgi:glycosyltransferase involved in cell wall biosynthesis
MPTLSVVIITKNEEANLTRCLEAVRFAHEIIVLDSGSTDNTLAIAKSFGAKIYHQDWLGYGAQKNRAVDYAGSNWILSLDADEVLDPILAKEVRMVIETSPQNAVFEIERYNYFLGKRVRHVWNNDWVLRLFPKGAARFSEVPIHEALKPVSDNFKIQRLKGHLAHYTVHSLEQYLTTMNRYTSIAAARDFEAGKKSSLFKVFYKTLAMFLKSYFFKRGFLDGRLGLLLSCLNAQSKFYQYLKLYMDSPH